jgi:hypothetical protein
MAVILGLLAVIGAVIGFFSLSQATMGVGILAIACLLAILARIAQADAHQNETKKLLQALNPGEQPKQALDSGEQPKPALDSGEQPKPALDSGKKPKSIWPARNKH